MVKPHFEYPGSFKRPIQTLVAFIEVNLFIIVGQPRPLFCLFHSFKNTILTEKL